MLRSSLDLECEVGVWTARSLSRLVGRRMDGVT